MRLTILFFTLIQILSTAALANEKSQKGLLPEIQLNDQNEDENDKRAMSSELMITRSENKAIDSLQKIIKKKKGSKEEADLWYRLAELYMRRSKSGRFFDLHQDSNLLKLTPFPVANEKGAEALKRANNIYTKIEIEFPTFIQMDSVLFNNGFALQQLNLISLAEGEYQKLLKNHPQSPLIPDGTLALGELLYNQGKFKEALEVFTNLEKFPKNRIYSYGLYKAAWTFYNLKDNEHAIAKLVEVAKVNTPLKKNEISNNKHHLRKEALNDLTVFVEESYPATKLYSFFEKTASEDELGPLMIGLAKLFDSHSRQKEMSIFLEDYITHHPFTKDLINVHLILADANETLKKREQVLNHLQTAHDHCKENSIWVKQQDEITYKDSCIEALHHDSASMAKKWWDIWVNNKTNKEFTSLTQRLFQLILTDENPGNPDVNTRFAFAELLFNLEKFDEASEQYKMVSDKTKDATLLHDATYSALFSKEKSIEKKSEPAKLIDRKNLALIYLSKNPHGKYARQVQFKLGHIAYEAAHYQESEKWLLPLTQVDSNDGVDLKIKSEDLLLDMFNIRKDFVGFKKFAESIIKTSHDEARIASIKKVLNEATYAEIQEFAKTGNRFEAAKKLIAYANQYKNSPFAQDALWQSLSLLFADGRDYEGANLSVQFVKRFPQDKRNEGALKEAVRAFTDSGQLLRSAEALKELAKVDKVHRTSHLELAADILILEKKFAEARALYFEISNSSDSKTQVRIYGKVFDSYKQTEKDADFEKVKNIMLTKGIEPYATQFLVENAKSLFDQGKFPAAFDLTKKINGREVSSETRAAARLIQAQILEKELAQQSVKAREDKFALVLSMKAEKLDKAQMAYFSALKMSKDASQQFKALQGIDRCYTNFINSLEHMTLPADLSAPEQASLRAELQNITAPIKAKQKENAEKISNQIIANDNTPFSQTRRFINLSIDQSIVPTIHFPTAPEMAPFIMAKKDTTIGQVSRLEKANPKLCDKSVIQAKTYTKENFVEIAGQCLLLKQFEFAESIGLELAKTRENRALGLYIASLAVEGRGLQEKSSWLSEAALKIQGESAPFIYQKARLTYKSENAEVAFDLFDKVFDMNLPATEVQIYKAVKKFSEGDFKRATEIFSELKIQQIYNFNMESIYSEALAQSGQLEKALNFIKDALDRKQENADLLLQEAHLLEAYKQSPILALSSYERALKTNPQDELRDWLNKKIEYLKTQSKVGLHVTSGDFQ